MRNKTNDFLTPKEKASKKIRKLVLSVLAVASIMHATACISQTHFESDLANNPGEVMENCEMLGVNYDDLQMFSLGVAKFNTTSQRDNNNYLSIPLNRCMPKNGNVVKVYIDDSFSPRFQQLAKECVDEINYIAKNIGDPISYEYETGNFKDRQEWDIVVKKESGQKKYPNGKNLSGEATGLYIPTNGSLTVVNPTVHLYFVEGEHNGSLFQRTFMHEFAHLIYGAKDIYTKESEQIDLVDFEEADKRRYLEDTIVNTTKEYYIEDNASESIMNNKEFFSAGDILLWSAKNSLNVEENVENIKAFARDYQSQIIDLKFSSRLDCDLSKTTLEKLQDQRTKQQQNDLGMELE